MRAGNILIDSARYWGKCETNHNLTKERLCLERRSENILRPVLFSRGKTSRFFYTEDSKLYITPHEQNLLKLGIKPNRSVKNWDSLSFRIVRDYEFQLRKRKGNNWNSNILCRKFLSYRLRVEENLRQGVNSFRRQWSLQQLWNFSVIGAVLLGMISMTLIYKFLGPGAVAGNYADNKTEKLQEDTIITEGPSVAKMHEVLGASAEKSPLIGDDLLNYIEEIVIDLENKRDDEFEKRIRKMVKGYPIEKMVPEITKRDRIIAALLIGIAKKESNWGKRVPVLNGEDCFNYWGYRGIRKRMGTGGHTCFDDRKDAVDTVAKRLETLVYEHKRNTPDKLIIWKCGSACHKDNPQAVRKWISDVELYFSKLKD